MVSDFVRFDHFHRRQLILSIQNMLFSQKYPNHNLFIYEPLHEKTSFFCLCENKDTDQLCSNCKADQRLYFHFLDSTILRQYHPKFQAYRLLLCVRPGQKPKDRFSHFGAHIMHVHQSWSKIQDTNSLLPIRAPNISRIIKQ